MKTFSFKDIDGAIPEPTEEILERYRSTVVTMGDGTSRRLTEEEVQEAGRIHMQHMDYLAQQSLGMTLVRGGKAGRA